MTSLSLKNGFLWIVLAISLRASTQSDSLARIKEINDQIWKPFTGYIISGDNTALSSLHSKRISRIQIDQNSIIGYDKYFPANSKEHWTLPKGTTRLFELRFDKRICDGDKAWETGYYKGGLIKEGKETNLYYGRFYVVLEKENGVWKIIMDADTTANATEENFKNSAALQ